MTRSGASRTHERRGDGTAGGGWSNIIFSAFKDMFGKRSYSPKWKNIAQGGKIKMAAHDKLLGMEARIVQDGQIRTLLDRTE